MSRLLDRILSLPNFEQDAGGAAAASATTSERQQAGGQAGASAPAAADGQGQQPGQAAGEGQAAAAGAASGGDKGKGGDQAAAAQGKPDLGLSAEMKAMLLDGLDGDAKAKAEKWLGTRSSVRDIFKSAYSADSKISEISEGRIKVPTGKDDDPKDVAAFRKALGVPEAADKYAVWQPDGAPEMNEADKEMWDEALKDFHGANMGQRQVDAVAKAFARATAAAEKAMTQRAAAAAEKAQEDLRVEYGRDYKPNIELANRWLGEQLKDFGADAKGILNKRFDDGTALGEHPDFVKWIVSMAKQDSDAGAFVQGVSTEGVNIDKRIDELSSLQTKDPKKYGSREVQDELQRLIGMQAKRQASGRSASEQGR